MRRRHSSSVTAPWPSRDPPCVAPFRARLGWGRGLDCGGRIHRILSSSEEDTIGSHNMKMILRTLSVVGVVALAGLGLAATSAHAGGCCGGGGGGGGNRTAYGG